MRVGTPPSGKSWIRHCNAHNGHDFGSSGANERMGLFSILHVQAGNEEKHYYIVLPANSLIFIFPAVSSPVTDEDRMEEGKNCGKAAMWFSIAGAVIGIITIVVIIGDIVNKNEDYYCIMNESIFSAHKRSLGQGNVFYTCLSFCSQRGGGLAHPYRQTPSGCRPPWIRVISPGCRCPQMQVSWVQTSQTHTARCRPLLDADPPRCRLIPVGRPLDVNLPRCMTPVNAYLFQKHVSVILSRGQHGRRELGMAGDIHAKGDMHSRGHTWQGHAWQGVWQGTYMARDMHGEVCMVRCVWQGGHVSRVFAWQGACVVGVCMAGGMYSREMCMAERCMWQGGMHGREYVRHRDVHDRAMCVAGGMHGR